jgi:hypothetical protein
MSSEHDYIGQQQSEAPPAQHIVGEPLQPGASPLDFIQAFNDVLARVKAIESAADAIDRDVKAVTGVDIEEKVGSILKVIESHLGVKI